MDRFELARGDLAWLFMPLALTGVALNGAGWILIGTDITFRHCKPAAPGRPAR